MGRQDAKLSIAEAEPGFEARPSDSPRSLMQAVWARMGPAGAASSSCSLGSCRLGSCRGPLQCHAKRLEVRLWCSVAAPIISVFLALHLGRFLVSELRYRKIINDVPDLFASAIEAQWQQSQRLLDQQSLLTVSHSLFGLSDVIRHTSVDVLDRSVDGLWTQLLFEQKYHAVVDGSEERARWKLAFAMWSELEALAGYGADSLFVGWLNGGRVSVTQRDTDGQSGYEWYDGAPASTNLSVRLLEEQRFDTDAPLEVLSAVPLSKFNFFSVQQREADIHPTGPLVQAWSGIYHAPFEAHVSWTAPIAYCGNYSCFEGVISANVALSRVNRWTFNAWSILRQSSSSLDSSNSAVFIVLQDSDSSVPTENGILVAWSWANLTRPRPKGLLYAVNCTHGIVSNASRAILQRYGAFNASELKPDDASTPSFTFKMSDSANISYNCTAMPSGKRGVETVETCFLVTTHSTSLDPRSRWLLVSVTPANAFGALTDKADALRDQDEFLLETYSWLSEINIMTVAAVTVVTITVAVGLVLLVSPDLRRLSAVVKQLETLDFKPEAPDLGQLSQLQSQSPQRTFITEVGDLQEAFCRLRRGVQAFAKFVPEAVVRNILIGDEKLRRLHVKSREVTAMFSNILGFGEMSETLPQEDLLLVLTRYLTFMTQIVEQSHGVVAEILGDGMLAFWNTPETITDHPTLACAAALAMQRALASVNAEFEVLGLPPLRVRTGLHTGLVLSGNLGSERKMKFGCMGDAVNLASRLQGLCKHYDVDIICSGATQASIDPLAGLTLRCLDLVQVKGKQEATCIYEVCGANGLRPCNAPLSPRGLDHIRVYEEALQAFQAHDVLTTLRLTEVLLKEAPQDAAARRLHQRASAFVGPGGEVRLSEAEIAAWTGILVMSGK